MAPYPDHCPRPDYRCASQTFQRFGQPLKRVRDLSVQQVRAQRWRCTVCGYTFRLYPQGITHRQQSLRLQGLSICLWLLGLSLGGVAEVLLALGCPLSRSAILGNLRRTGTAARRQLRARLRNKVQVKVIAMDPTHVKLRGQDKVVMQTVDAQKGITLEITILPGEDERTITRYVQRMAKLTGCEVLVSDDADSFKAAADAAGIEHHICQQHVVPNSLTLLSEIAAQLEALPEGSCGPRGISVEQALADIETLEGVILARSPGSVDLLEHLRGWYEGVAGPRKGEKASPWYRLHLLTLDLAEDWRRLTLNERYRDRDGRRLVPATNNVSERGIGLNIKERYRTMRGYKSKESLYSVPALTAYLRENQGTECLTGLLAA